MGNRVFDAFETRGREVSDYVAGHGVAPGADEPLPLHQHQPQHSRNQYGGGEVGANIMPAPINPFDDQPLPVEPQMDFAFGMEPPPVPAVPRASLAPQQQRQQQHPPANISYSTQPQHPDSASGFTSGGGGGVAPGAAAAAAAAMSRSSLRNPSILSYGGGLRNMSLTSDATFGRAMSGLSALSIDWENLEDFDLEVDHSAHINNSGGNPGSNVASPKNVEIMGGPRRSSLRRSFMSTGDKDRSERDAHVSFKV